MGDYPLLRSKVILQTEGYTLYESEKEDWPYWIEIKGGKGMSLTDHDLNDALDEYFTKNF